MPWPRDIGRTGSSACTTGDDPPDAQVLQLDSRRADIAEIRRWARSVLPVLDPDDLVDVQLVVTELVTNVYDHALFPARLLLRQLSCKPCVVKIAVERHRPC